ncbi:MAG: bifunctional 4-hydroxy-2-oxoglutarate aldolase/2-dehydro-3-deoxy-phosphogluconate aldolase [Bacteroidetes bacterium]|nr:bifunctional 4-hydroxy-2-oxoglutarate aldolase/2-dehydro-3-deoxy-phosphogluconate aldolase [Bacteroidota bacterium]
MNPTLYHRVTTAMQETGLVPLFTHDKPDTALAVINACAAAGVRAFEFTNRRSNSFEIFRELNKHVRANHPDLLLGIGTVLDAGTTERYIEAGADFIISPVMKPEMAPVCKSAGVPWIPGCATLTEIVTARDHGAGIIKIFPGSVLGPEFVRSILPVIPELKLMITGGVEPTEESITRWFDAGAFCLGLGSNLFTKEIISRNDWETLRKSVLDALSVIRRYRSRK